MTWVPKWVMPTGQAKMAYIRNSDNVLHARTFVVTAADFGTNYVCYNDARPGVGSALAISIGLDANLCVAANEGYSITVTCINDVMAACGSGDININSVKGFGAHLYFANTGDPGHAVIGYATDGTAWNSHFPPSCQFVVARDVNGVYKWLAVGGDQQGWSCTQTP